MATRLNPDGILEKAYLRPEMTAVYVGAEDESLAAGLARQVNQVLVLSASQEGLSRLRRNLEPLKNINFQLAESQALPVPGCMADAVFAELYPQHAQEPQAVIRELARLLKPGGRLVIAGRDLGGNLLFGWLEEAGLVNIIIQTGREQDSQASMTQAAAMDAGITLAIGAQRIGGAQGAVQQHYAALAQSNSNCCSPALLAVEEAGESVVGSHVGSPDYSTTGSSCCAGGELISLDTLGSFNFETGYTPEQSALAPQEAVDFALGCGNPTAMADLRTGEKVLDIGSGGGLDAFIAARKVGVSGRVIGVDMTPQMLERARAAAKKAGLSQVQFRQGKAEALPVAGCSMDVVLSNCVINLSEDKGLVFREAFRVLKPGGRLEISDMVTDGSFPASWREDPRNWGGCVFGALPEGEYLDLVRQAGFYQVEVRSRTISGMAGGVRLSSISLRAVKPQQDDCCRPTR